MDEQPKKSARQRVIDAGLTPCPKCIWFNDEVTCLCENHQRLADDAALKSMLENP
jgi:hypothetical protein